MMQSSPHQQPPRHGFTLVEILVVISIMLLLLSITVYAVNYADGADRVRGSASQVQSFLGGAQDRAIYEKSPVGVRLFLDSVGDQTTVSSMAYIASGDLWTDGGIQLQRWDANNDGDTDLSSTDDINGDSVGGDDPTLVWVVAGEGTGWWELKRRGLLVDDLRIRIPRGDNGTWYPINTRLIDVTVAPDAIQKLILRIPYTDPGDTVVEKAQAFDSGGPSTYELELPPTIMPLEPALLADDTVIDLDASRIPASWGPFATESGDTEYSRYMDIMFSPRGNVLGSAASQGLIHLYVCSRNDSLTYKDYLAGIPASPAEPIPPDEISVGEDGYPIGDRRIVSVFTQTGAVTLNLVNPEDTNTGDGVDLATDPYLFAEAGSEAN